MFKKLLFCLFFSFSLQADVNKTVLVFGGNSGYLGQSIMKTLQDLGCRPVCATSRLENREAIEREIKTVQPAFIINAAGITGKPNIDWCETHRQDTIRVNVMGTLNLIDVAYQNNLHITNISTGSMYKYDEKHQIGGVGFSEEDEPNFDKAFYTKTKIALEKLMLEYPNVLNLRITMPVSSEDHPKNFIVRLAQFKKVMTVPISLSVLDDLWPIAVDMSVKGRKGNYNFVNPGAIGLDEMLDLYREYIDQNHKYETFSALEQIKIMHSNRANAELSANKLLKEYPNIPPIRESVKAVLQKMKESKK